MTLTIGTSPALVSDGGATSLATASFTRPEGGLLVAMVMATTETAPTVSGGSLTWTRQVQRTSALLYSEIWTAPVPGSGSMTVTLGGLSHSLGGAIAGLKVACVSGQHADDPIGATGSGVDTTNILTAAAYNSTSDNSRGFLAAVDGEELGSPSVGLGDSGFPWTDSNGFLGASGAAAWKATNTATQATAVSFSVDAPGTAAADWAWTALEILPAAVTPLGRGLVVTQAVARAAHY